MSRRQLENAPLHAFNAPVAGTGKTLLVELISLIATGMTVPKVPQAEKLEEFEKQLGAMLIAGVPLMVIDNCTRPLEGSTLNAMLTTPIASVRLLGYSRIVNAPTNAALFATGNDFQVIGDMARRAILCTIDARTERPELRRFTDDVKNHVQIYRKELVRAALTVLRAWHLARCKGYSTGVTPLGSFEHWSVRIRDLLIWLGEADPCKTMDKLRKEDPKRQQLVTFIEQWKAHFALGDELSAVKLIETVSDRTSAKTVAKYQDFRGVLAGICTTKTGELSPLRLGKWLGKHKCQPANGYVIDEPRTTRGVQLWKLVKV